MPRAFDTFLNELYGTTKRALAEPAPDVPAQFSILAVVRDVPGAALIDVQRTSRLPFTRFAPAVQSLLEAGLLAVERTDDLERLTLTPTGLAVMDR